MSASGPAAVLHELMTLAGTEPGAVAVRFTGADPVLPTPLRIGDFGAAAIAAAAAQAARLYEHRTGRPQEVHVAVDAAAAAMRGSRYIRQVDGDSPVAGPKPGMSPVAFCRTRDDRWIFYQRLFPHHLARQLAVLGCSGTDEEIRTTTAKWDGAALEDAIAAAGACAALVRTRAEWAVHEQALAISRLPLFEITRIGDGPAKPTGHGDRPLTGLRVLDVTRVLAGPTCGRTLAEHGADVLRVGLPVLPDSEPMLRDTGFGKRSCVLDLKQADGAATLLALAREADVFCQGYRPGALAALGFSPEALAERSPGIVVVSISAFGHTGPWRERRGFDSVVQAASGVSHELGGPDGVPRSVPANPLDYITGYLAAFGVMLALERRAREGGSYHVRLSLARTSHFLNGLGRVPQEAVARCYAELPAQRLAELLVETDTPFGRLRHLAPVASMTLTPPRWDRPSVPIDHDGAEWTAHGDAQ
jgi:crotonobetainyl-CoA:carnitine CoA-transferase CaiB-like acyl-CoA transferase